MKKEYELAISLKELLWNSVFSESYRIALRDKFVENKNPKEHGFKNHLEGFVFQLKQNSKELVKQAYSKRQIYVVSYGMNTGSEINGDRPSLIYKASDSTLGEDVIVIPLTSAFLQKQSDKYDIFVPKDKANNLFQNSYARLRQIRSVSIKRVGKSIGTLADEKVIQLINEQAKKMLWINE